MPNEAELVMIARLRDETSPVVRNMTNEFKNFQTHVDPEKIEKGFKGLQGAASSLSNEFSSVLNPALASFGLKAGGVIGSIVGMTVAVTNYAKTTVELKEQAEAMHLSLDELKAFDVSAKAVGLEGGVRPFQKMTDELLRIKEHMADTRQLWANERIGGLYEKLLPLAQANKFGEAMGLIVQHTKELQKRDPQLAEAFAQERAGVSAARLTEAWDRQQAMLARGYHVNAEQIAALREESMKLSEDWDQIFTDIMSGLVPATRELLKAFSQGMGDVKQTIDDLKPATQWIVDALNLANKLASRDPKKGNEGIDPSKILQQGYRDWQEFQRTGKLPSRETVLDPDLYADKRSANERAADAMAGRVPEAWNNPLINANQRRTGPTEVQQVPQEWGLELFKPSKEQQEAAHKFWESQKPAGEQWDSLMGIPPKSEEETNKAKELYGYQEKPEGQAAIQADKTKQGAQEGTQAGAKAGVLEGFLQFFGSGKDKKPPTAEESKRFFGYQEDGDGAGQPIIVPPDGPKQFPTPQAAPAETVSGRWPTPQAAPADAPDLAPQPIIIPDKPPVPVPAQPPRGVQRPEPSISEIIGSGLNRLFGLGSDNKPAVAQQQQEPSLAPTSQEQLDRRVGDPLRVEGGAKLTVDVNAPAGTRTSIDTMGNLFSETQMKRRQAWQQEQTANNDGFYA